MKAGRITRARRRGRSAPTAPSRRSRRRSRRFAAAAWSWSQDQFYVGEQGGTVVIFRGIDGSLPGLDLSHAYERSNVELDRLCDFDAGEVRDGISASSLQDARDKVDNLATKMTDGGDC